MKHFGNDKIMGHSWDFLTPRKDEVEESTQTDCSRMQDVESDPRTSAGKESPKKGCLKGNPPESGNERIFVLRNCNQCQDYTVAPCCKCRCPRKTTSCKGNCKGEGKGEGETVEGCPRRQTTPERHEGGTCPLCQSRSGEQADSNGLCGGLCKECNCRIHDAMGKYFMQRAELPPYHQSLHQPYGYAAFPYSLPLPLPPVQQAWGGRRSASKGQPTVCDMRQPSGTNCDCPSAQAAPQMISQQAPLQAPEEQAPAPQTGQWQPISQPWAPQQPQQVQQILADPSGAAPLNIIVLQDCDNNALIDQLTTAISRSGGQGQPPPPLGMDVPHGYSNYKYNNPLSYSYTDYEMADYNRAASQQQQYSRHMDYDDGYNMEMDGYMDTYQQSRSSCDMASCPVQKPPAACACAKTRSCTCKSCQSEGKPSSSENRSCNCDCKCPTCECKTQPEDCEPSCEGDCARKCCKTELSALLTKALEIFIGLSEQPKKRRSKHRPYSSYSKKKGVSNADYLRLKRSKSRKRVASGSTLLAMSEAHKEEFPLEFSSMHTATHTPTQSGVATPQHTHPHTPRESHHELGKRDYLPHGSDAAPFFLPNCEKNRCKHDCQGRCSKPPHNCGKGCKGHCKGPCHKRGGGDAASRRQERSVASRHARCFQCNAGKALDAGRTWQPVDTADLPNERASKLSKAGGGCAGCAGGSGRRSGGDGHVRRKNGLLGLSPIAHYRPGMLQFPVNYLLTGANTRRSLVRTAAGVTLHQSPHVNLAEHTQMQPPRRNRKRSKWQTVPSRPPGKYALSEIEQRGR
ncbi:uncharacterized protein LOC117892578 isoform X1 [Drosophila subobscura]|uniref:uncharacterized protein LOC117892578 isoform X1 n=1 Tax=Drosophila subobscura TaxID=7241 RepID=UPI00155B2059|nr:uncharacterized protein LOC117892578 isoform X1 [Drosophila subobscura]